MEAMSARRSLEGLRRHRNSRLYRSLTRTLRVYNRLLVDGIRARGFDDFSPAFPQFLSNLDTRGTRIGVIANRAGVSRQAAGQMLRDIERCGYIEFRASPADARATMVHFTARGRRLLDTVLVLVEEIEGRFAEVCPDDFDRLRIALRQIADVIDPDGALGSDDAAPASAAASRGGSSRRPGVGRRRDGGRR